MASDAPRETAGRPGTPQASADDSALDPDQQAVLGCLAGSSLVFAGPGTGKTHVLTRWVARQVETGAVPAEKVLALTFTNRAAEEMRERLAGVPSVRVATFHSFSWSVLREKDPSLSTVLGRDGREALLGLLFPERSTRVRALADAIERRWEGAAGDGSTALDEVMRLYEEGLARMGAADISSLVARLVGELDRDARFLASLRDRHRAIAVDELQDINDPQYQLLCMLTGGQETAGVLCIGDPDQAIYGFRGSDRELSFRFQRESSARTFTLSRNYRSTGAIVQAAAAVIAAAAADTRADGLPVPAAVKPFGAKIALFRARDPAEEALSIVGRIRDLVGGVDAVSVDAARARIHGAESGYSFADIAVLFRTRAVRDSLLPTLSRAGLPLSTKEAMPLAAERPFSSLLAALRLVLNAADRVSKAALREHLESLDGILAARDELLGLAAAGGTEVLIGRLLSDFLRIDESDPGIALGMETIREAARGTGADLARFLAHVSLCTLESESARRAEKVTLLTFHAAKGLEFPVVFIAGAEEGITPLPDDLEEERRLFYVAMTRAADLLFISRSEKRFVHGKEREMQASRFLSEIPPECLEEQGPGQKKGRRGGARRPENQLTLFG